MKKGRVRKTPAFLYLGINIVLTTSQRSRAVALRRKNRPSELDEDGKTQAVFDFAQIGKPGVGR